jgi:iron(III) transport system substrate-binding protein
MLSFTSAHSFESEDQKKYPGHPSGKSLMILSTADISVFEPIILDFQKVHPYITIVYTVASSVEVMRATFEERVAFDLVISSAMDLQTKLANDGFAKSYASTATESLPTWAKWRNQVFAFTQEPAVMVLSIEAFKDLPIPSTREELITLLRNNAELFKGKIGTYDVRTSGLGYLFATQDSRNTESFWRLTEVMGRLDTQLYCCSGQMITDVSNGRLAIAYNVLGSYANSRHTDTPGIKIVPLNDFISVMLRTALIPTNANNPTNGGLMIDFLSQLTRHPELTSRTGLPPIDRNTIDRQTTIRLGPGLLVFLDTMRRDKFLKSWVSSIIQK